MRKLIMYSCYLSFFFLNSIFAQNNKNILYKPDFNQLIERFGHTKLIFHIPPKQVLDSLSHPHYIWVDGYRIQVAASSSLDNALNVAEKLKKAISDSIYIERQGVLYRVQFGDYTDRIVAETKVDSMRKYGWPEAWIVTRKVKKYVKDTTRTKVQVKAKEQKEETQSISSGHILYAVQIAVFSTQERANHFKNNMLSKFKDLWVFQTGSYYKILIGKFTSEEEARKALQSIQQAGFNDAWVTEILLR